jgi:dihydrofolate reductase
MSAVLLGRVTYQIMVNAWPNMTEETSPSADRMNNVPKIVFSRTLDKVEWGKYDNARLVKNNESKTIKDRNFQQRGSRVVLSTRKKVKGA